MYDVAIIGGGLSGLVNSILLRKEGFSVILFEEKQYPFHRVCGEYISNEVIPFLKAQALFPEELNPSNLTKFHLSSVSGKSLKMPLDLGGFGVSRYSFDEWLGRKASSMGVALHQQERATDVDFSEDRFEIQTSKGSYTSKVVIGSFGKRTKLDKELQRKFIQKRSPYIGVKYHLKTDLVDSETIELHNFPGGYCGISMIEKGVFNLCYLSHRSNLKKHKDIAEMERKVLCKNPFLSKIFTEADFLFDKPEVINEISFEPKEAVYKHILMCGDSAGMITPLCGNGMAMAIHASKILSEQIKQFLEGEITRKELEVRYAKKWNATFAKRHWAGRKIQSLFGSSFSSELGVGLGKAVKPVAQYLMSKTHGSPF